jgi:Spy/CpxP family protein refolding chaperone
MNRRIATLLGSALLACSLALQAQTPAPAAGAEGRKGPTPEQRQQMKERFKAAHEACKDKSDRRACMHEQYCAKSPDPAKCVAEGKARRTQHLEARQKAHEACTGKRGDELASCLQANRPKHGPRHHGKPEAKKG